MLIDCGTCSVRGKACTDCVVTYFIAMERQDTLDREEAAALGVLADSGLVPPLRMTG